MLVRVYTWQEYLETVRLKHQNMRLAGPVEPLQTGKKGEV